MIKNILVSGGAVGAHLDSVKVITNNFKGGRMLALAKELAQHHDVRYLSSIKPVECSGIDFFSWQQHTGYDSYRDYLLTHAMDYDAIILGAAIANLIPKNPWKGKFPSHDYNEGDIVPIDFIVAPRIINMVRSRMKRGAHLFGFKLLDSVPHEELINAAYDIVIDSKSTAVFANDRQDLDIKYAVTKEMGEHVLQSDKELVNFINLLLADSYYTTIFESPQRSFSFVEKVKFGSELLYQFGMQFNKQYGKAQYRFGTVAMRCEEGFLTTVRGKKELGDWTHVLRIDNGELPRVVVNGEYNHTKATLNAPLLGNIFSANPRVQTIIHYHEQVDGFKTLPYAPPGTVRDSVREDISHGFNIEGHGTFKLFNGNGEQI